MYKYLLRLCLWSYSPKEERIMKMTGKMRKLFSILLCLLMLVQSVPMTALAAGENTCAHHTGHTDTCGYGEGVSDCAYQCRLCPVQALINALPEVTSENLDAVTAQLAAIDEAKAVLSDAELALVDFSGYNSAISAINVLSGQPGAGVPDSAEETDSTYTVTASANPAEGGIVISNNPYYVGEPVSITVIPEIGYKLVGLEVKDVEGNDIETTEGKDNTYNFTMPASNVTFTASFQEDVPATITGITLIVDGETYQKGQTATVNSSTQSVVLRVTGTNLGSAHRNAMVFVSENQYVDNWDVSADGTYADYTLTSDDINYLVESVHFQHQYSVDGGESWTNSGPLVNPGSSVDVSLSLMARDNEGNLLTGDQNDLNALLMVSGEEVWLTNYGNTEVCGLAVGTIHTLDFMDDLVRPEGYQLPEDVTFTVDVFGNITVTGGNATVETADGVTTFVVVFQPASENPGLDPESAPMLALKAEDAEGNTIEDSLDAYLELSEDYGIWISNGEPLEVSDLSVNSSYVLAFNESSDCPEGYLLPGDITFTVGEDGTVTVTSGNATVVVEEGTTYFVVVLQPAPKLALRAVNAEDQTIEAELDAALGDHWISNDYTTEVNDLSAGNTYTLDFNEDSYCPEGYLLPEDITFTVDENGAVTVTSGNATVEVVEGTTYFIVVLQSVSAHQHQWSYELGAEKDTLIASCSAGTCEEVGTLGIGAGDAIYDGCGFSPTVYGEAGDYKAEDYQNQIVFYKLVDDTYVPISSIPTDVGTYKAIVTVDAAENFVLEKTYTITCDHSYNENKTYIINTDGTHTLTCSVCKLEMTEPHTFDESTHACVCGLVEEFTLSFYATEGDAVPVAAFSIPYGTELSYDDDEESGDSIWIATEALNALMAQIDTSALTREHYTFRGWDVASGPDILYEDGAIYGCWTPVSYTITWEMNGCDYEVYFPDELPTELAYNVDGWNHQIDFARLEAPEGYKFVKFVDGNGNELSMDDRTGSAFYTHRLWVTVSGHMTIKAVIEPMTYMATWSDGNGASYEKEFTFGETITIPDNEIFNDTFREAGYTLTGWEGYTEGMTMPIGGVTFYPIYTPNQYTITFDTDGGSNVKAITQGYESAVTAPEAPTREGYHFVKWEPALPETMPLNGLTVKAVWEEHTGGEGTANCEHGKLCGTCSAPYGEKDPGKHSYTSNVCCGTCGENVTWELTGGVLTIRGTGAMNDYPAAPGADNIYRNNAPWKDSLDKITSVVIQPGVTSIGDGAFYGCKNLTSAAIPAGITNIGALAFYQCGLTSVTVPASVKVLEQQAFGYCGSLTSITLHEGLESIGHFAFDDTAIETLTIPDSVTYIGRNLPSTLKTLYLTGDSPDVDSNALVYIRSGVTVYVSGKTASGYDKTVWQKENVTLYLVDQITSMEEPAGETYSGKAYEPNVTVTNYKGEILANGTDYTVSYSNNVNAGEAAVTVTGAGNYGGTLQAHFKIAPLPAAVTPKDQTIVYGKDISIEEFTVTGLLDGHSASVTLTPSTENLTVDGTITASNAVITAGTGDVTANYTITYGAPAKLVIQPDTSKIDGLTVDNVTTANEADIQAVQQMLENAESTDPAWEAIGGKCDALLEALIPQKNAEAVEDTIGKLPETAAPDDEAAAEKILAAKEAYDALTNQEKALVAAAAREKLEALAAALTSYDIIKGDGSSWDGSSGLSFTANGPFRKFVGIKVDGTAVDAKDYEARSGSTVITLKESFLQTLSEGTHTITVIYTDGETSGTFRIPPKTTEPTTPATTTPTATTPATGDNANLLLWVVVLALCMAGMVVVLVLRKKRNNTK